MFQAVSTYLVASCPPVLLKNLLNPILSFLLVESGFEAFSQPQQLVHNHAHKLIKFITNNRERERWGTVREERREEWRVTEPVAEGG